MSRELQALRSSSPDFFDAFSNPLAFDEEVEHRLAREQIRVGTGRTISASRSVRNARELVGLSPQKAARDRTSALVDWVSTWAWYLSPGVGESTGAERPMRRRKPAKKSFGLVLSPPGHAGQRAGRFAEASSVARGSQPGRPCDESSSRGRGWGRRAGLGQRSASTCSFSGATEPLDAEPASVEESALVRPSVAERRGRRDGDGGRTREKRPTGIRPGAGQDLSPREICKASSKAVEEFS